ncbi:hypothetical protein NMY22_g1446 [Coprinellus aureogranulatus]|nr:hypothetical protein NMY22_g1446 [Coprinellus aureogranulatus]
MTPISTGKGVERGDSGENEEANAPQSPPTKKRAPRRGKLGQLPLLPLDILSSDTCHLLPIEILHLSRTTKAFYSVLLHANATSLWKRFYAHPELEDIPKRPEDVSFPVWTNLLFDHRCHIREELLGTWRYMGSNWDTGPEFEFLEEYRAGPGWFFSDRACPRVLTFHSLKEVQQAAPITDRTRNNCVKEPVVGYIEEVRKLRLDHERRDAIDDRGVVFADAWVKWLGQKAQVERCAPETLMPSIADVIEHPTVKALLEAPGDAEVTEQQCMAMIESMQRLYQPMATKNKLRLFSS